MNIIEGHRYQQKQRYVFKSVHGVPLLTNAVARLTVRPELRPQVESLDEIRPVEGPASAMPSENGMGDWLDPWIPAKAGMTRGAARPELRPQVGSLDEIRPVEGCAQGMCMVINSLDLSGGSTCSPRTYVTVLAKRTRVII